MGLSLLLISDFRNLMFSMFRLDRGAGGGGGDNDVLWHRLMQSRARGHEFRAWASVLGAASRGTFVAVLGRGFAAHVFGIGRLPVSSR